MASKSDKQMRQKNNLLKPAAPTGRRYTLAMTKNQSKHVKGKKKHVTD